MGEFVANRFSHILFIYFRNLLLAFYLLLYGMSDYLFCIFVNLLFYNDTNMQTDNERYRKMASLAQIGWWEVDLTAGYYLCSDYLSDLLGLDGDTISTSDFLNLIREDYRKQIAQEFRANSSIHKDFYEQTFPIHSKYGEVWLHTRLVR
mgnify:CR=1 FL=1